jgi:hypothetical protein
LAFIATSKANRRQPSGEARVRSTNLENAIAQVFAWSLDLLSHCELLQAIAPDHGLDVPNVVFSTNGVGE